MVSSRCLEEVNRLRGKYRKDLGTYEIPVEKKKRKMSLTIIDSDVPPLKKPQTKGSKENLMQ